eukprot:CAMPEP_0197071122 /NCGR_PEP_ID=MMETSP1384-20130603/204551_1 /TAXON_ID=29189 /ORGANISM="Ammonia sp." /LENGTH=46 /DNA_ID= /DNA_START= /DNA_END= /DNA_ORIENTATION=
MKGDYIRKRLEAHGLKVVVPKKDCVHQEMERIIETELSFNKFISKS